MVTRSTCAAAPAARGEPCLAPHAPPTITPMDANLHGPPRMARCTAGHLGVGGGCCGPTASSSRSRGVQWDPLLLPIQCTLNWLLSPGSSSLCWHTGGGPGRSRDKQRCRLPAARGTCSSTCTEAIAGLAATGDGGTPTQQCRARGAGDGNHHLCPLGRVTARSHPAKHQMSKRPCLLLSEQHPWVLAGRRVSIHRDSHFRGVGENGLSSREEGEPGAMAAE